MRFYLSSAFALAVLASGPAHASVAFTSVGGDSFGPFSVLIDFNSGQTLGNQAVSTSAYTFSGDGIVQQIPNQPGVFAAPAGDTTPFLTTGSTNFPGGTATETLKFLNGISYSQFGLYWGSIDTYNTISFLENGVAVPGGSFTGSAITATVPANADGDQASNNTNRYVTFSFTGGSVFNEVLFQSTSAAFEIDDLTANGPSSTITAVPEISTWAMLIIGFMGIGFLAYGGKKRELTFRFS
jgi:hypothetical protein